MTPDVCVDCLGLTGGCWKGLNRYGEGLTEALVKLKTNIQINLIKPGSAPDNLFPKNRFLIPFRDNVFLPLYIKKLKPDLLHILRSSGPILSTLPVRKILTFHDFISFHYPQMNPRSIVFYKKLVTQKAIDEADLLVCVSENTKQDLLAFFRVEEEKTMVIHEGVDARFFQNDKKGVNKRFYPKPFILTVSTISPRKNHIGLIKAFEKIAPLVEEDLVIVGNKGWHYGDFFRVLEASPCRDRIRLLEGIGDDELILLYSQARLFVYPSFYEGFGLPPLEAMASGTPVITSNTSSLPEVVGDAGIMVDPRDTGALAREMLNVLQSDTLASGLIKKGVRRARGFSWEKTAEKTVEAYETVIWG
jgi:glycosyltransferase involved in cell wall biosynthesis